MKISWNREEGFRLDLPYSGWLVFCLGLSLVLPAVTGLLAALRDW